MEKETESVWPVSLIGQCLKEVRSVFPTALVKSVDISFPGQLSGHPHVKIEFTIITSTAMAPLPEEE